MGPGDSLDIGGTVFGQSIFRSKKCMWSAHLTKCCSVINEKESIGDAGVRTRGLSHAKRTRYHCATSPDTLILISKLFNVHILHFLKHCNIIQKSVGGLYT